MKEPKPPTTFFCTLLLTMIAGTGWIWGASRLVDHYGCLGALYPLSDPFLFPDETAEARAAREAAQELMRGRIDNDVLLIVVCSLVIAWAFRPERRVPWARSPIERA